MASAPHPIVAPFTNRSATEIIAYEKLHQRVVVADADEVRNTDFTGQFGGLYIRSIGANYNLDTDDLSADDLSVDSDTIIDEAGNHFLRVVDTTVPSIQTHTVASSSLTIADDDTYDEHEIVNTSGGPIDVFLPSLALRSKAIRVVDAGGVAQAGNAATHNITVKPKAASGHTVMGAASYVIDSNGGSLGVAPNSARNNWR